MSALDETPALRTPRNDDASQAEIPGRHAARRDPTWPPVSVIMPVLDEEAHLQAAVEAVLRQDYPGDLELVMALGPSRDRTDEIAAQIEATHPQVRTVRNPSGATPSALNAAVAAAANPIVVRIDGHAVFPLDYIRTAVEVLTETGADNVGGIMAAEGVTALERAVARAMTSRLGVGQAPYHTGGDAGPADSVYLGVFRREALARVGGYDEDFLRAQDWEMNLRIRNSGGLVWFTPRLRVSYRPRGSVRGLARQYFDYGRWRRVVMRRHEGSVRARYLAPPIAFGAVVAGTAAGIVGLATGRPGMTAGFVVPVGYLSAILAGSVVTGRGLDLPAMLRLPVVYATMHGSWAVGFLTSPRDLIGQRGAPDGAGAGPICETS
jgi:succinoglycan biosynthesis protein ExoA